MVHQLSRWSQCAEADEMERLARTRCGRTPTPAGPRPFSGERRGYVTDSRYDDSAIFRTSAPGSMTSHTAAGTFNTPG